MSEGVSSLSAVVLETTGVEAFIRQAEIYKLQGEIDDAHALLSQRSGPGAEYLGWLDLPATAPAQVAAIKEAAQRIRDCSTALVVVGIGGSYLGARAAIEGLTGRFHNHLGGTRVYFAGHNLSSAYHADLLKILREIDFSVNVISKSGTTTEPALAFRILKELLEAKHGRQGARRRIYVTTGAGGALRTLAETGGYATFAIPEDVGGRYSVLTPVGLLPMAVAGIDVAAVLAGAGQGQQEFANPQLDRNSCYRYAAVRNVLYRQGRAVELLVSHEPGLHYFCEWWKQLFAESEGKDGKGIFPAAAIFTTDLHSLGQYIQEGPALLFETVLKVDKPRRELRIPHQAQNTDGLNYLAGSTMDFVSAAAFRGTLEAHIEGGVPALVLRLPELAEQSLGYLFYFMEKACALSGYLLGVNPFNQPGVEAYKKNMFSLLKEIQPG